MLVGFLTIRDANLKMASRTTNSMTPLDPPPSNDKIEVVLVLDVLLILVGASVFILIVRGFSALLPI